MILCSDCHGSDTSRKAGGSGPDGVHGPAIDRPRIVWRNPASLPIIFIMSSIPAHGSESMPEDIRALKARIATRNRALAAFNRWEAGPPGSRQSPEQVLAALGTLYDLLPAASRRRTEDPGRSGVRSMQRALSHLHECP